MQIKLTKDQLTILKFLNDYYINQEAGCTTVKDWAPEDTLDYLEEIGFAFHTDGGYFITTIGQDYLAEISENR